MYNNSSTRMDPMQDARPHPQSRYTCSKYSTHRTNRTITPTTRNRAVTKTPYEAYQRFRTLLFVGTGVVPCSQTTQPPVMLCAGCRIDSMCVIITSHSVVYDRTSVYCILISITKADNPYNSTVVLIVATPLLYCCTVKG